MVDFITIIFDGGGLNLTECCESHGCMHREGSIHLGDPEDNGQSAGKSAVISKCLRWTCGLLTTHMYVCTALSIFIDDR